MEPNEIERFEAVVLPHLSAAYTLARYLLRHDHDAEDVVQEAYLRALKYFAGYRGADTRSARAWLLTIVRHTAFTWRRQHQTESLATEFDETQHGTTIGAEAHERAARAAAAAESLRGALDRLPPEFSEVIVLRELQGLSYKEISDVTEVPVGTVMSRLARARKRLSDALSAQRAEEER